MLKHGREAEQNCGMVDIKVLINTMSNALHKGALSDFKFHNKKINYLSPVHDTNQWILAAIEVSFLSS